MSRTLKYKRIYIFLTILAILVGSTLGIALFIQKPNNIIALFLIPILFLIPGRIQGHLYRESFRGRKLMINKQYEKALLEFRKFLTKLEQKVWLKKAIWLGGFVYTKDIEAMTLNNMGACSLELGDLENAESYLESALLLDEKYAIPYFNLAVVSELRGNHQLAITNLNKSIELGFANTSIDSVLVKTQEIYARVEGGKLN